MKAIRIKTIRTVLTAILLSVMLLPASSQEIIPFEEKQSGQQVFESAIPSSSNPDVATINKSGPNRAAPPGGGNGLGITPVRDVFWLLPILAILYGIIRANRRRGEMNNE